MINIGFQCSLIRSGFRYGNFIQNYLVKLAKKPAFLDIEILGVLLLENSIAWETKRFFWFFD